MSHINFSNSSFINAFLNGNDFSNPISRTIGGNANFYGANLSGVNFENVNFTNATLTEATFSFSKADINIDDDRSCPGHTKKPSTNSSTTCPNGSKPNLQCNLLERT
ncbi:pentapeptide repeat-containing protein [Sulfurimonas sp. MAG313]|nr:pentapeptide repeat-containing protein [Sulfurimonas sp. MAG313]